MAEKLKEEPDVETPESVFPLALTPIEKFFFWDDRPEQPLSFFVELRFNSSIDINILESCIAKVIERNPLLRAHVTGDGGDLSWTLSGEPFKLSDLTQEPPIVNGVLRTFDLRNEVASRFWCETTSYSSRILVQTHHSACDGIAFRGVLIDVLHLYALATGKESESSRDRSLLCDRYRYSLLHDRYSFHHLGNSKRETSTWQRIKNAYYFHFQPPTPLAKGRDEDFKNAAQIESTNPLCNMMMDGDFSQAVLRACQSKDYSINELAIAILFRTCFQWNRRLGDKRRNGRLRILMPLDVRGRMDIRMPAANRLAMSFLGREYSQCDNLNELIAGVHAELNDAKETHLFLDLLQGIKLGCKLPLIMKWVLRNQNSMATAVISYVGDISRGMNKLFPELNELRSVGNASLFSIMAAPPTRRNTNISMAICINWGRICISANWNRSVFTEQDCRAFLELYRTGWQQWIRDEGSNVDEYAEPKTV